MYPLDHIAMEPMTHRPKSTDYDSIDLFKHADVPVHYVKRPEATLKFAAAHHQFPS